MFDLAGSMAAGRYGHRAVRLQDGRLLVVGGNDGGSLLRSAEVADPITLAFTPAGELGRARWFFAATLLDDGRVLVTGGQDRSGHDPIAARRRGSSELFDPFTGRFTDAGSMAAARLDHTATRLADGRVLIAGGSIGGRAGDTLATAELYDPATGRFASTGSMHQARQGHTATSLETVAC
jgi:hypothetical protein